MWSRGVTARSLSLSLFEPPDHPQEALGAQEDQDVQDVLQVQGFQVEDLQIQDLQVQVQVNVLRAAAVVAVLVSENTWHGPSLRLHALYLSCVFCFFFP